MQVKNFVNTHIFLSVLYIVLAMVFGKLFDLLHEKIKADCNKLMDCKVRLAILAILAIATLGSIVVAGNEMLRKLGAEYW